MLQSAWWKRDVSEQWQMLCFHSLKVDETWIVSSKSVRKHWCCRAGMKYGRSDRTVVVHLGIVPWFD